MGSRRSQADTHPTIPSRTVPKIGWLPQMDAVSAWSKGRPDTSEIIAALVKEADGLADASEPEGDRGSEREAHKPHAPLTQTKVSSPGSAPVWMP